MRENEDSDSDSKTNLMLYTCQIQKSKVINMFMA